MIVFEKIAGNNFMCFEKFELQLSKQGKTLILGRNNDDKGCNSNMAGKTTLLEAILWVLYGNTSKGISGDGVIRYGAKNCDGTLWITKGKEKYEISRYRKHKVYHNNVVILHNGETVTEADSKKAAEYIDDIINMSFDAMVNSIFFTQEIRDLFITMTDANQKKMLDGILKLSWLDTALDKVKKDRDKYQEDKDKVLAAISQGNYGKEMIEEDIVNLKKRKAEVKEDSEEKVIKLYADIKELKEKNAELAADRDIKAKEYDNIDNDISVMGTKKLDKLDKLIEAEENKLEIVRNKQAVIAATISSTEETIQSNKNKMTMGKCPTCGQLISDKLVAELQKDNKTLESKKATLENESAALIVESKNTKAEIAKRKMEQAENSDKITALKNKLFNTRMELTNINRDIKENDRNIVILKNRIADEKGRSKDIDADIKAKEVKLKELKDEISDLESSIPKLDTKMELTNFWIKGFGNAGIKSFLLDSSVPIFNNAVNKYARIMTDREVTLEAKTQSQIKTGEQREKFHVVVKSKKGEVDFESYSGGYKKRLLLMGAMGLHAIVKHRSGNNINLFVADEPAESLDETGTERLMELFDMLENEGNDIFVISHTHGYKSYFNNVVTVTKEDGISTIR